jgi:hypothetical protein
MNGARLYVRDRMYDRVRTKISKGALVQLALALNVYRDDIVDTNAEHMVPILLQVYICSIATSFSDHALASFLNLFREHS